MAIQFFQTANFANSVTATSFVKSGGTSSQYLMADGSVSTGSSSVAWTDITSKPTTISGFGITDAFDGAYSSLTGTPTIPTDFVSKASGGTFGGSIKIEGDGGSGKLHLRSTDTAITDGDYIGNLYFEGVDSGGNADSIGASIHAIADGTWSNTVAPTELIFKTRNTTGGTTTALTLNKDQSATFAGSISASNFSGSSSGTNTGDQDLSGYALSSDVFSGSYADLTNVPSTFAPSAHNHDGTYLKLSGGTMTGDITMGGISPGKLKSNSDLILQVDADNNTSGSAFKLLSGGGSTLFKIVENGNIDAHGVINFTGTATTTSVDRGLYWTGFDKEQTTDFTDNASITHTTNTGGHSGSVLEIKSMNDAGDGIAFTTHASSLLKHNGNAIFSEGHKPTWSEIESKPSTFAPSSHNHAASEITSGTLATARLDSSVLFGNNSSGTNEGNFNNWNDLSKTGFYSDDGATGRWTTDNWSSVMHFRLYDDNNNWASQLGFDTYDTDFYYRRKNNGTWSSWFEVYHEGHKPTWSEIESKPSTFTPSSHNHAASEITSGTFSNRFSTGTRYSIGLTDGSTSQTRDKLRVWSGGTYTIGMKSGFSYGHLNDYAMSFQMNSDNDRGWWWGDTGHSDAQGAMSLTTNGRLTVATSLSIGQGESVTSPSTEPLYLNGNAVLEGDVILGTYSGTTQARLFLTGTTANKQSLIQCTNGNLHIDSEDGHSLYLNYYEGTTDNVIIGNGNGGASGTILKSSGRVNVGEHLIAANSVYAAGNKFVFGSSTTEGEYIQRNGNNIEFIAGGGIKFDITSGSGVHVRNGSSYFAQISNTGEGRFGGDVTAYYNFSDKRLKTNIKPITGNLDKVLKLNPVEYNWKEGYRKDKKEIGLIAQEVEKIIPEVVREKQRLNDDTLYKQVDYEHLVSTLIGAVQEQQKQIDELKSIINGSS